MGGKEAAELFEEVGHHPTLDEVMMRDPREGRSRGDAIALLHLIRQERATHITESEAPPPEEDSDD